MSRLTIAQARDAMCGAAVSALPVNFPISFPDKPFTAPENASWARVTVKLAGRAPRGMGDAKKKYVAFGTFCIQLFSVQGDGLTANDTLADNTVLNLESVVSSPITYRNIRAVDIGPDGAFTQTNIYADFEYEDHH